MLLEHLDLAQRFFLQHWAFSPVNLDSLGRLHLSTGKDDSTTSEAVTTGNLRPCLHDLVVQADTLLSLDHEFAALISWTSSFLQLEVLASDVRQVGITMAVLAELGSSSLLSAPHGYVCLNCG